MKKLIMIIAVLFIITGCGSTEGQKQTINNILSKNIHIVYLEDGTKCAVYSTANGKGISCDWK